ncbi:hypothetical protein CEB3_c14540 [Peptococcaceae bacterium CEB3]|nr:hypothetical protein CEB3_c14540 [Peptococcaceae bacterium CEB3]
MLNLVVGLVALLALVFVVLSDFWTGKHSRYFESVQKPSGKQERNPVIPDASGHDDWFHKLNSL